mmetsp:Transcript_9447/g.15325  ORF Transcript_9447/g.15325 Transcript_9447/m.15325 type:complete len:519 (-) Transcript_9447:1596-3152(-)
MPDSSHTMSILQHQLKFIWIESVAWNKKSVIDWYSTINSNAKKSRCTTRPILIGTRQGEIFEIVIEDRKVRKCECVWELSGFGEITAEGKSRSIQGIEVEPLATAKKSYFIVCCTPSRLYHFYGGPNISDVFQQAEGFLQRRGFHELPSSIRHTELHLAYKEYPQAQPHALCWLTQPGVFYGRIRLRDESGQTSIQSDGLLEYPSKNVATQDDFVIIEDVDKDIKTQVPISMGSSKLHSILLYQDRLVCIHSLSKRTSFSYKLNEKELKSIGPFCKIAHDRCQDTFWVFSTKGACFEVLIEDEGTDSWLFLARAKRFDEALESAGDSIKRRKEILAMKAEQLFEIGQYEDAAQLYAEVPTIFGFSEVASKFLQIGNRKAATRYGLARLKTMPPKNLIQSTIIATWLVQLFLDELQAERMIGFRGRSRAVIDSNKFQKSSISPSSQGTRNFSGRKTNRESSLKKKLLGFLEDYEDCIDANTVFRLISERGMDDILESYAILKEEREWLIDHFCSKMLYI